MPLIGIITCEILELEFAYLLSGDQDIAGITVIEDAVSNGFINALKSLGRFEPRTIPVVHGFTPAFNGEMEVLTRVLELALHSKKRLLQEGVQTAVKEMAHYVDAIFLGYGLCGNALQNPEEMFEHVSVPIFIPMDEDHPVDDCVGLVIGGREHYYGEQCKEAGTFFMIPGWTRHWRRLFDREYGKLDPKMAKRMFSGYKRSLIIPTPVCSEEEMRRNIEEFNLLFGFGTEVRKGTLNILYKAWELAKKSISKD